jgi:hypothetical protein
MTSNRKTARGLVSTLGLALLAMLALGAITAGASQAASWHVGGKAFSGTASFFSVGTAEMELSIYGKFTCKETATGKISNSTQLEEEVTLSSCVKYGCAKCVVDPITWKVSGSGEASTGTNFRIKISAPMEDEAEMLGFSFSYKYGAEAAKLAVTTSGASFFGTKPTHYSGTSTWTLTGANEGKTVGYW